MVARTCLFAALFCVVGAGCQQQRMRESFIVDAFSAEARVLEDKIYELNDRIDDLESRVATHQPTPARPGDDRPGESPSRAQGPPQGQEEMPDLTPPDIVPGTPVMPDNLPPPATPTGPPAGPSADPPTSPPGEPDRSARAALPTDTQIDRVALSPQTRAVNLDDAPGDDGIWVVVQPLNHAGRFVPQGASMTVVLLDATTRTHVGRWEFDAKSTEQAIGRQDQTDAIFLRVRWDEQPPGPNLHLFVRYETEDGRKLEANQPLTARLDHHVAQRWTPRSNQSPTQSPTGDGTPRVATQPPDSAPAPPATGPQPPRPQGPPADVYR